MLCSVCALLYVASPHNATGSLRVWQIRSNLSWEFYYCITWYSQTCHSFCLSWQINEVKLLSCEKTLASLCLLEVLCTSEPFSTGVLSEIEADTITDVIQYQLQSNPVAFNWNNKQPSGGGGERMSSHSPAWR